MKTISKNALNQLNELAQKMPSGLSDEDKNLLNEVYHESLEDLEDPNSMFNYSIAKAMRKHFAEGKSNEHIYLQKFEIPQIRLFELLIQQFPLANLSQHCMNTLLATEIANYSNPVLMDIGIGTGFQVCNIIEAISKNKDSKVQKLTIIGIEPFREALLTAQKNIANISEKVGFEVELVVKEAFIEKISFDEISVLLPETYEALYVNASFALHHIQLAEDRKIVFEHIKALNINAFALSEPNSNHFEKNYHLRFKNCVYHYGLLFRIIDTLAITNQEKAALKLFFSREIDDVLGNSETVRVEKHYATEQWVKLFEETGFTLEKKTAEFDYTSLNGAILQQKHQNRYSTEFEGEEITSLFWAK